MAERINVVLVDDLDGSLARHTVTFAIDGVTYEIDLNDKNAKALRNVFAYYIPNARKHTSAPSSRNRAGKTQQERANKQITEQIRSAALRTRELYEAATESVADVASSECADVGLFVPPPATAADAGSPSAPVELPQFSAATGQ